MSHNSYPVGNFFAPLSHFFIADLLNFHVFSCCPIFPLALA